MSSKQSQTGNPRSQSVINLLIDQGLTQILNEIEEYMHTETSQADDEYQPWASQVIFCFNIIGSV